MQKTKTSRPAVRNTPQTKAHKFIAATFRDDFGRDRTLSDDGAKTFTKKKLGASAQALLLKNERAEKKVYADDARQHKAAVRRLKAEEREAELRGRKFFRRLIKTQEPLETKLKRKPPRDIKPTWQFASIALPKYDGPIIDRNNARGVFARFRYYASRTAKAGVSARVVKYMWNGAAADKDGNPYLKSNMGQNIEEIICAADHIEQINRSAQKNAKVAMHGVFAVDYRQTPEQMLQVGYRWAEGELGKHDLPYLVVLHAPPEGGDPRNWHLHILWSWRPFEHVGDHEWMCGEALRTDLDSPKGMWMLREKFAEVMTEMSMEAGQGDRYTAKSHAARGLPLEPQQHLSEAKTNRARKGELVAENENNHERVMRSKAAMLDEKLRHLDNGLSKQQRNLRVAVGRWARPLKILPTTIQSFAKTLTSRRPLESIVGRAHPVVDRLNASVWMPFLSPKTVARKIRFSENSGNRKFIIIKTVRSALTLPNIYTTAKIAKIANLRTRVIQRRIMMQLRHTDLSLGTGTIMASATRIILPILKRSGKIFEPIGREVQQHRVRQTTRFAASPTAIVRPASIILAELELKIARPIVTRKPEVIAENVPEVPASSAVSAVASITPFLEVSPVIISAPVKVTAPQSFASLKPISISSPRVRPAINPVDPDRTYSVPPLPTSVSAAEFKSVHLVPKTFAKFIDRNITALIDRLTAAVKRSSIRTARSGPLPQEQETAKPMNTGEELFIVMNEKRRFIQKQDGVYRPPAIVISEPGLVEYIFSDRTAQKQLAYLHSRQSEEMESVCAFIALHPGRVYTKAGKLQLSKGENNAATRLIVKWSNDQTVERTMLRFAEFMRARKASGIDRGGGSTQSIFDRLLNDFANDANSSGSRNSKTVSRHPDGGIRQRRTADDEFGL